MTMGMQRNNNTKTDVSEMDVLSFTRRIRYFSDGVMLGSKTFCEHRFSW